MRFAVLIALLGVACATETWKTVDVDRSIDASSQIVKITTLYTFENVADDGKSVLVAIPDSDEQHLAHFRAQQEGAKGRLKIVKDETLSKPGFKVFKLQLPTAIAKGQQVKVRVNLRLTQALTPLPAKITQDESQFVVYSGSAYVPSFYPVANQKTVVKLAQGGKTLSATTVNPSKQETEKVTYGPYANIAAFEQKPIKVHFENNTPFVVATLVERVIEVSHWGNIAVEEYIELVHKGAELKGSFSRLDYQMDRRGRKMPALQQFTTTLPATAKHIYYRDEIGNISTSAVRVRADSVDVEIRPRFPLFGGWRTSYVIGYNVPSSEYLHNEGSQYGLKMRVLDHIFDNIVVEKLVTKIILPEHVRKVKLATPYGMERLDDEVKPTYLDVTGRLVVSVSKNNLVEEHIQAFTLTYEFEYKDMLREPLLATAFFFTIFLAIIIYVRFDFTIVADPEREAREKVQVKLESLGKAVEKKQHLFDQLVQAAADFKSNRDAGSLAEAKKSFNAARSEANDKLTGLINSVKNDNKETFESAQALLSYDKLAVDGIEAYFKAVEKSTQKSAGPEEHAFSNKVQEVRKRADSILASL